MHLDKKVYDILKTVALIWLPALGTLYFTLAAIWHLPSAQEVVNTIIALDTFLGVVLQLSTSAYNKSDDKYDGEFAVVHSDGEQVLQLKSVDYEALNTKNELVFKLTDQGPDLPKVYLPKI